MLTVSFLLDVQTIVSALSGSSAQHIGRASCKGAPLSPKTTDLWNRRRFRIPSSADVPDFPAWGRGVACYHGKA